MKITKASKVVSYGDGTVRIILEVLLTPSELKVYKYTGFDLLPDKGLKNVLRRSVEKIKTIVS